MGRKPFSGVMGVPVDAGVSTLGGEIFGSVGTVSKIGMVGHGKSALECTVVVALCWYACMAQAVASYSLAGYFNVWCVVLQLVADAHFRLLSV